MHLCLSRSPGLHSVSREPVAQPLSRLAFEFDRRKLTLEDVRDLIYREILEYHPAALSDYVAGIPRNGFVYPSALDSFKRQFMACEGQGESWCQSRFADTMF